MITMKLGTMNGNVLTTRGGTRWTHGAYDSSLQPLRDLLEERKLCVVLPHRWEGGFYLKDVLGQVTRIYESGDEVRDDKIRESASLAWSTPTWAPTAHQWEKEISEIVNVTHPIKEVK